MQVLLPQFFFRVVFGIAIAIFVMPPKCTDRSSVRLILWGLTGIAALAATILYVQRSEIENGVELCSMAVAISATAFAGSVLQRRDKPEMANVAVGALSLLGLIFSLLATPWSPETASTGLALGTVDLASCGLILGATMSAALLCLWHLNTPNMQTVPLRMLVVLMASATTVRTALCIVGSGIVVMVAGNQAALLWVFVGSRWIMALLGLAMLFALSKEQGKPPQAQRGVGWLFGGLSIVTVGELGSQLVSVNLLYPF